MENARTLTVSDARSQFADVVNSVVYLRQPAVITKNGKKAVAIVPYEILELFSQLEALVDIRKAQAALESFERDGGVTLEELKKELEME